MKLERTQYLRSALPAFFMDIFRVLPPQMIF